MWQGSGRVHHKCTFLRRPRKPHLRCVLGAVPVPRVCAAVEGRPRTSLHFRTFVPAPLLAGQLVPSSSISRVTWVGRREISWLFFGWLLKRGEGGLELEDLDSASSTGGRWGGLPLSTGPSQPFPLFKGTSGQGISLLALALAPILLLSPALKMERNQRGGILWLWFEEVGNVTILNYLRDI